MVNWARESSQRFRWRESPKMDVVKKNATVPAQLQAAPGRLHGSTMSRKSLPSPQLSSKTTKTMMMFLWLMGTFSHIQR